MWIPILGRQNSEVFAQKSEIPLTAVSGSFKSFLGTLLQLPFRNPTHGSGWMVQVRTIHCNVAFMAMFIRVLRAGRVRIITMNSADLNHLPTAGVGFRFRLGSRL